MIPAITMVIPIDNTYYIPPKPNKKSKSFYTLPVNHIKSLE